MVLQAPASISVAWSCFPAVWMLSSSLCVLRARVSSVHSCKHPLTQTLCKWECHGNAAWAAAVSLSKGCVWEMRRLVTTFHCSWALFLGSVCVWKYLNAYCLPNTHIIYFQCRVCSRNNHVQIYHAVYLTTTSQPELCFQFSFLKKGKALGCKCSFLQNTLIAFTVKNEL